MIELIVKIGERVYVLNGISLCLAALAAGLITVALAYVRNKIRKK